MAESAKESADKAIFWRWTAIIAVCGLVLAAPGAIFHGLQAYRTFTGGPSFEIQAEEMSWKMPKQFEQRLESLDTDLRSLRSKAHDLVLESVRDEKIGKQHQKKLESLHDDIKKLDTSVRSLDSFSAFDGFLKVKVTNIGKSPAENARLKLNGSGIAIIERENGSTELLEFKNEIPIGELPNQNHVTVSAWLNSPVHYSIFTVLQFVHKAGFEDIKPQTVQPTESFLEHMSGPVWPGVFGALFGFMLAVKLLYQFFERPGNRESKPVQNAPAPDAKPGGTGHSAGEAQ